uniref:Uncharacterized protein n=1 Tax=Romanomermis culicivorax TaxID=13658 RepID=A0A915IID5_ROMCU
MYVKLRHAICTKDHELDLIFGSITTGIKMAAMMSTAFIVMLAGKQNRRLSPIESKELVSVADCHRLSLIFADCR